MLGNIINNKSTVRTEIYRTNNPKKYHGTLHKVLINYYMLVEIVKGTGFMENERLGSIIAYDVLIGRLKSKEWFSKLKKQLGDRIFKEIENYVYIRINTLVATKDDFKNYNLIETCVPNVFRIVDPEKAGTDIKKISDFYLDKSLEGKYKIQNLSSCLPAFVLNPEENSTVIDATAAPGNKTTHLCSIMNNTGRIYAFEKDKNRSKLLESQVIAYNATNVVVKCADFLTIDPFEYKADYILLDPSCSGSGIHLNYKKDQDRVNALHNFQEMMLNHAFNFNPKKIVYSVCSVHAEEGEEVVKAVLKNNSDYELETIGNFWEERGLEGYDFKDKVIRSSGKENGLNGFFVALFKKK